MDYLVIGGWAAIVHGLPRTTLDVDLFVRPSAENVRRLIGALSEIGHGIAREVAPEEILEKHVFLFADQIRIDVFTRPWGLDGFSECRKRALEVHFEGIRIPVLGVEDLIRSKETDRESDREDIEALRRIAGKPRRDP